MILQRFGPKTPLLLVCSLCAVWLLRAVENDPQPVQPKPSAAGSANATGTNTLVPGPNDGAIAYVAARVLEGSHFLRHKLDDEFSAKFFDRYIETFDPQHVHFTEADLAEFGSYRTNLDDLTITRRGVADLTPAYTIFARFLQRLEQRVTYAETLLKNEKFQFDDDERILLNRKDAPYPRDLDEARQLWRQRLRFEYLQEKLGQPDTKKKTEASAANKKSSPTTTPDNSSNSVGAAKERKKKTGPEEIVDTLTRRYARNLHMFQEWDNEDLLQTYINALAHVYDPHSDYFNSRQAENFAIGMNLALFGIGALLTTDLDGYCKIQELKPGPAMNSKNLNAGDRIVAVAQSNAPPVDVVEMNLNKVVQLIRGPKGTEVRLTVVSPDDSSERRIVTLIRDEIKLEDQAAKAKIIELPVGDGKTERLGVIDLPSFYATIDLGAPRQMLAGGEGGGKPVKATPRSTSVDVAKLLTKLKRENVSGIILDLRRNGGGSLEEAVKLTGLFIKEGPVVQVSGPDGKPMVDSDDDPSVLYDGPMIVLTSRFSASASEIVAGALQDYGRALIVGDISTHGKGTVQNLNPLSMWVKPATATATNDPGALKITIRKFYRAGGASTQLKGVLPDIVLPSVLNYSKDIGENALENPLAWDTIPSARFDKLNLVEPCLPELLQHSNERLATNQDFVYIREDIDLFKKRQTDKTISLNERERLKEKETDDARQKARDKERLARKDPEQKVFELTLKQVDLPGLPPPLEKTNTPAKSFSVKGAPPGDSGASATVTAKAAAPASDLEGEDAEDKPSAVDAMLDETERILMDYITLLTQKSLLTVNH
jgi:carboxyl-terminal processing protease